MFNHDVRQFEFFEDEGIFKIESFISILCSLLILQSFSRSATLWLSSETLEAAWLLFFFHITFNSWANLLMWIPEENKDTLCLLLWPNLLKADFSWSVWGNLRVFYSDPFPYSPHKGEWGGITKSLSQSPRAKTLWSSQNALFPISTSSAVVMEAWAIGKSN